MLHIGNKKPPGGYTSQHEFSQGCMHMATFAIQTIADKIVETLYSNRVTPENKSIHTPPLSPSFKVGVFAVF